MKNFVRFFLYLLPGIFTVTLLACNYAVSVFLPGLSDRWRQSELCF